MSVSYYLEGIIPSKLEKQKIESCNLIVEECNKIGINPPADILYFLSLNPYDEWCDLGKIVDIDSSQVDNVECVCIDLQKLSKDIRYIRLVHS